jgi:hypothetical protein
VGLAGIRSAGPNIPTPEMVKAVTANSNEKRYNDFGGADKAKAARASKTPEKDLLSGAYVKTRKETIDRAAIERGQEATMDRLVDDYRAVNERMRDQRASRVEMTKDLNEKEAKAIEKQREALEKLEPVLSNTQRFMTGLRGETDQLGNAFERFGDSVGRAFGDVRNLFSNLKSAIKSFFADITGGILRNVAGSVLGPLIGRAPSFGGAGMGGGGGGFFTGGFAGGPGAASTFGGAGGIIQQFFGGGGGTVGGGGSRWIGSNVPTRAGKINFLGGITSSLRSAFSGINGPLFGAGIGSMLGGQSVAGNILGSAGGALATGFITSSLGLMGSGAAAALFSNPFTAIAGAGLLVGSILLGKAKQRKADERVVDTYWVEYSRVLKELTAGVNTDQIGGDEALSQAAEARQTAVDLISQIKTKSVAFSGPS